VRRPPAAQYNEDGGGVIGWETVRGRQTTQTKLAAAASFRT
jgi:hypothetical protein